MYEARYVSVVFVERLTSGTYAGIGRLWPQALFVQSVHITERLSFPSFRFVPAQYLHLVEQPALKSDAADSLI